MGLVQSIAVRFRQWHNDFFLIPEPGADHLRTGELGERAAARFLRRSGYKVLYRNFRAPKGGEVDLVCRHGSELVFAEVKTRSRDDFGDPSDAVNRKKQDLIARGAVEWLRLLGFPDVVFRFDIVEVRVAAKSFDCTVIQDAFSIPERYLL